MKSKWKKVAVYFVLAVSTVVLTVFGVRMVQTPKAIASVDKDATHQKSLEKKVHNHENRQPENNQDADDDDDHKDQGGKENEKAVHLNDSDLEQFGIEITKVGNGKLKMLVELSGEVALNADQSAHIVPRVPGVVREVRKGLGDTVKTGEVLAVIESRELADAKAEYLSAREKCNLAQEKFSREETLWKKKISAEQDYLDAKQALAETRIAQRAAEQKLHALGFSHDYLNKLPALPDDTFTRFEIIAPLNGTVIEKHLSRGEVLKEDADIFTVADLSTVWVNLNIYPKDLAKIKKGQPVNVSAGNDLPESTGEIIYIGNIIKEETRTALARVMLTNPSGHWRPGLFVNAKVAGEDQNVAMLLPKTALQSLDGKASVFVKTDDGFKARPVAIGRSTDSEVEILSGISAGDQCVTKGTFTLKAQLAKGAFGDGHNH